VPLRTSGETKERLNLLAEKSKSDYQLVLKITICSKKSRFIRKNEKNNASSFLKEFLQVSIYYSTKSIIHTTKELHTIYARVPISKRNGDENTKHN
jgi:hypothetical protein